MVVIFSHHSLGRTQNLNVAESCFTVQSFEASISNTASHCAEWKESRVACIAASVPDI